MIRVRTRWVGNPTCIQYVEKSAYSGGTIRPTKKLNC